MLKSTVHIYAKEHSMLSVDVLSNNVVFENEVRADLSFFQMQ